MKTHTSQFKEEIKKFGRQLDSIITYTQNGETIELGNESLNSVAPHYEGSILKSVMKQLDIDSNIEIPIGTELNYQFGVKTRSGKNLFDKNNANVLNGCYIGSSGANIGKVLSYSPAKTIYIPIKANTTYTVSKVLSSQFVASVYDAIPEVNSVGTNTIANFSGTSITITSTNDSKYLAVFLYVNSDTLTFEEILATLQIEEGNEATEYETYGMYDYIDFGNYIVKDSEKQEDNKSYKITCYDKMLYSMKDYEDMEITYPITIRNYINAICTYLNITFANASDVFVNYDKEISKELYLDEEGKSLGYTFRGVLDELAQVTASTICINENDELEIRYLNNTEDTINEEYLKDINVNFGEKYGPVNTIVLSRSAGADKISLSTSEDIPDEEKIAIEISDNQIMNFDNRSDFMGEILSQLAGLQYYINDFSSTGICYYDLCDMYNIQIGNNIYNCIMFNDEVNITQGLEELIHTEIPDTSEQEYKYMDSTDKRINKTTLIVDKQGHDIEALITDTTDTSDPNTTAGKLAKVRLDVDSLTNIFQITGGSNVIKNSQFLLPDKTWLFENYPDTSNNYHTALGEGYDNDLIGSTIASAKITLRNMILSSSTEDTYNNGVIDQIKNIDGLIQGQTYTLSYLYNQNALTTTRIRLIDGNGNIVQYFTTEDEQTKYYDLDITYNEEQETRKSETFQFIATTKDYQLIIETYTTSNENGYFYIYDLMLNSGDKKQWEPASSEIYSTVLQMSQQGLKVISTGSSIATLLNARGLNIYKYDVQTGQISGEPVTEFDDNGLTTYIAIMSVANIDGYVMKTITINNKRHHIEYFGGE